MIGWADAHRPATIDSRVAEAIGRGAHVVFSLSGDKDSMAAALSTIELLDRLGHPRDRRIAIHGDLGRAEWTTTAETVQRSADALRLPLVVVRRKAGDLVARWEQRFENGKRRFETLAEAETIAICRLPILDHHGLENRFATSSAVIERFTELIEARETKARR